MTQKIDLSESTYKNIWKLALPVMAGQVLQTTFTIVDMKFIAMLGNAQAAAASVSGSVVWTLFSLMMMIAAGTTAVVARRVGEERREDAGFATLQSIFLSIMLGTIIAIIGFTYARGLLGFFGAEPSVTDFATIYMKTMFMGTPIMVTGMVLTAALQAGGDTKSPMIAFALANLINLGFDPILIFGKFGFPRLGIMGGALATVISQAFSITFLLATLYSKRSVIPMPSLKESGFNRSIMSNIIKIGFPSGIQNVARPITGNITFKVVALYGTSALAAFGFGMRALSFAWLFFSGLIVATSTLVGQNLGRKKPDEAQNVVRKSGLVIAIIATIFFVIYAIWGKYVIMFFRDDAEVVRIGRNYLWIIAIGMLFTAPGSVCRAAFTGAGDNKPPMYISLIANWLIKLPMAIICAYLFELSINWIWWAVSLSMIFEGGMMAVWFSRGKWKEKVV